MSVRSGVRRVRDTRSAGGAGRRALGALGALSASAALLGAGCMSSPCAERAVYSATAPGGRSNAVLLVRRCRGAPSAVTHVNLFDAYAAPSAEGDGTVRAGEVFAVEGEQKVRLEWKGERALRVVCVGCGAGRVSKKDNSWNDVQISYEEREP